MNQYSNENPERIRYWIKNNIHMVWDAVKKLQTIPNNPMVLKITFHIGSYPIVMQYDKSLLKELEQRDTFVSQEMWLIDSNFSSINAFADWVDKVQY